MNKTMNKKIKPEIALGVIVVLAIIIGGILWMSGKNEMDSASQVKQTAPVQIDNIPASSIKNKEIQSKKEYVNSIEFASGAIANPTVRDRIDYASLQFAFAASEQTKQNLVHVDRVDFYDNVGDFLGSMPKEKFTIDIKADLPADNLIGTLPLSVGNYLKGKKNVNIKYELCNGDKVFLSDSMEWSDPYRLSLEKIPRAPEFGISTNISLNTMLVPGKCDLYNEKDEKILEMKPKNVSNPSVFIKDIPKTTVSVYAVCYLSDESIVKTEALSLQ